MYSIIYTVYTYAYVYLFVCVCARAFVCMCDIESLGLFFTPYSLMDYLCAASSTHGRSDWVMCSSGDIERSCSLLVHEPSTESCYRHVVFAKHYYNSILA